MTHLYDGDLSNMNGMFHPTDMAGRKFRGRSLVELNTTGNPNGKKSKADLKDTHYDLRFGGISNAQYFHDSVSAPSIDHVVYRSYISAPNSYKDKTMEQGSFTRKVSRMQTGDGSFYSNLNESINVVPGNNLNVRGQHDIHDLTNSSAISRRRYSNFVDNYDSGMHVNDSERIRMIAGVNQMYSSQHADYTPYRSKANNKMRYGQVMEM
jgi:hypothetical protein